MRKIIFTILILSIFLIGCEEEEPKIIQNSPPSEDRLLVCDVDSRIVYDLSLKPSMPRYYQPFSHYEHVGRFEDSYVWYLTYYPSLQEEFFLTLTIVHEFENKSLVKQYMDYDEYFVKDVYVDCYLYDFDYYIHSKTGEKLYWVENDKDEDLGEKNRRFIFRTDSRVYECGSLMNGETCRINFFLSEEAIEQNWKVVQ